MKKFLSAVSIGYFLYGAAILVFVGFKISQVLKIGTADPNFSILSAQSIPAISLVVVGLISSGLVFWLGSLLLKFKKRKTAIVLACILLLGFPFGTVLGIVTLCLLQVKEIKNAFGS